MAKLLAAATVRARDGPTTASGVTSWCWAAARTMRPRVGVALMVGAEAGSGACTTSPPDSRDASWGTSVLPGSGGSDTTHMVPAHDDTSNR